MKKSMLVLFVVISLIVGFQHLLLAFEGANNSSQEEENMALVKRLINDAWNTGKTEALDEILAPDCRCTINGVLLEQVGPGPMKQEIAEIWKNSQDFKITIEDLFAKGKNKTIGCGDDILLHCPLSVCKRKDSGNLVYI